ncbi:MAG: Bug family tripartite tricarboxylate transporter substrate binding protein [Beijerinckiaceae bacterium]
MRALFANPKLQAAATVLVAAIAGAPASAQQGDEFYRGRTLNIVVGSDAGSGYDAYARLVGRHIGKHIPGNPVVVVQNQPGAGSVTMANTLSNTGARDGTTIGAPQSSVAFERLLHLLSPGGKAANFDATKLNWLGTVAQDTFVVLGWHKSKVRTTQDVLTQEFVIGTSGPNTDGSLIVAIMNRLLDTRIKLITGYKGTSAQLLALERGEIDGSAMAYATVATLRPNLHEAREISVLLQVGRAKHPNLKTVPLLSELIKDESDRAAVQLIFDKYEMGRPFFAPVGVPADRVALLRVAFDASMKDPELIAEAQKQKLEMNPLTGAQVQALVERQYSAPDATVRRARVLLGTER